MFANLQVIVPTCLLQESCPRAVVKCPPNAVRASRAGESYFVCSQKSQSALKISQSVCRGCYVGVVNDMYEFGEFRMDSQNRSLRRGPSLVPLTPKAFEVLLC